MTDRGAPEEAENGKVETRTTSKTGLIRGSEQTGQSRASPSVRIKVIDLSDALDSP